MVTIRSATVQDAPALSRLNVRVWQAAYGLPVRAAACGQRPDEHLDGLRPEERAAGWERGLSRDRDQDPVLVAEEVGRVVGFAVGDRPARGLVTSRALLNRRHIQTDPVRFCLT